MLLPVPTLDPDPSALDQEFAFQCELVEELRPIAYRHPERMAELMIEVHTLAEMWLTKGAFHQAEALYRRILYRLLDAPEMDGELIMGVSSLLADLQMRWGQALGARELYEKAAELAARLGIRSSRTLAIVKNNLGIICKQQGDFKVAAQCYEEALHSFSDTLGPSSNEVGDVADNMGALCYRMLEVEKALQYHERALAIRLGDLSHVEALSRTWLHLVLTYRALGRFEEAAEAARHASECRAIAPAADPSMVKTIAARLVVEEPTPSL